ncbi:MAG TPA: branched-chain amino acid ABC transporter permease [Candidatus Sulfotelmatobacter sp.]|nr:branched-chain amino acid ABC transporter permease [Candidatus Sulfotelmatobacter sp.]
MLAQHIVNGLVQGALYALVAVGLTLVYGILEVINFAHGELYMLGAFALYLLFAWAHLPYGPALLLTVLALAGVGHLLARATMVPHLRRPFESTVLATLAASIILQNGARVAFTATPRQANPPLEDVVVRLGDVVVTGQRLLALGAALLAFAALHLFIRRTRAGKAMRAAAQSKDACAMVGIDVGRVAARAVALGGGLCGLAGAVVAPLYDIFPGIGTMAVFKSFAVVIMGGLGNVPGAMAAAALLGVGESLAGGYVSTTAKDAFGFTLMILVLLVRPQGLFGRRVRV